jgi:hypothetical protein
MKIKNYFLLFASVLVWNCGLFAENARGVASDLLSDASGNDFVRSADSLTFLQHGNDHKLKVGRPFSLFKTSGDLYSSYAGISFGSRFFASVPLVEFESNGNTEQVDLGQGKPFLGALTFMLLPQQNGFAGTVVLDGFLGTTSGFTFHFGAGYKLGGERFSFTPTLSLGIGRLSTYLGGISIDNAIVPAALFQSGSQQWFVGAGADNAGRGGGSDIGYRMGSAIFSLKPSANIAVQLSPRLILFGDFGFNIVFAKTKNEFKLSGMGYDNSSELNQSGLAPHSITLETKSPGTLRDATTGEIYTKNPISPSGIQFSIGLGIPMN